MNWRIFAITAALFFLNSFGATQPEKPNIVFILADDLGYMDIGANNPKTFYETPNINALATQGMRFTSAYAACPVCSPTRASIMTGKYPARLGITDWLPGQADRPDRKLFRAAPVMVAGMSVSPPGPPVHSKFRMTCSKPSWNPRLAINR